MTLLMGRNLMQFAAAAALLFQSSTLPVCHSFSLCKTTLKTTFEFGATLGSTSSSSLAASQNIDGNSNNLDDGEGDELSCSTVSRPSRRHFFSAIATAAVWSVYGASATADDAGTATATTTAAANIVMKNFIDPYGMFVISVPEGFYTLRRMAKGDLPDEKTGKGRRGSSIFTAGNMAKAEVVAVERFPTRVLLEENGIAATGSLATFPDIGEPAVVAALINLRREKDKPGASKNTIIDPASVSVSADGKELYFKLKTEIDVQKPDLLLEQTGVSRLFRVTLAKVSLEANDGNLLAVFASALESDFDNTTDGEALQRTVDSFHVLEQSTATGS
mmetsp:Transcript_6269/g.8155  ORF Transcript_6269/g.8155 Transcript_6269/m.8155 type:complete len:333 (+) Transcript_6269:93-1091(+)